MTEIWKPVVGYEGAYEVSNLGRVRSLDRMSSGKYSARLRGRVLPQRPKPGTGYLSVCLCLEGRGSTKNVHRLVAEAFIGPRPDGMDTCHSDGDRLNNRANNLRYDTRGANLIDSVDHGTHPWGSRSHCSRGHVYTPATIKWQRTKKGRGLTRRCRICQRINEANRLERKRHTRQLRAA